MLDSSGQCRRSDRAHGSDLPFRSILQLIVVTDDKLENQMDMVPDLVQLIVESIKDVELGRYDFIRHEAFPSRSSPYFRDSWW